MRTILCVLSILFFVSCDAEYEYATVSSIEFKEGYIVTTYIYSQKTVIPITTVVPNAWRINNKWETRHEPDFKVCDKVTIKKEWFGNTIITRKECEK